ncbi:MAG: molybdopterin synthase sulfur carrier subunit [Verrucomicrobiota bacterium]|jgi:molybdopterin synthase catalytic subunit
MKLHVQFFSRLRELAAASQMELELAEGTRISDLLELLYSRAPALRDWDKSILVAAGVEFVGRDYVPKQDEQISIMPPVQGG